MVIRSRVSYPNKLSANRLSAQLRVRKGIPRTRPSPFWCRPYDHPENIQVRPVNLLGSYVSLLDAEARFLGLSGVHRVDLAMPIEAAVVVMAIEAVLLIQTVIAIVAILAVKLSGLLNPSWLSKPLWTSKPIYIFPESNRVSNIRNLFQGNFSNLNYRRGGRQDCHYLLRRPCHSLTLFVTVQTNDMTQVLVNHAGNVGSIDIDLGG